MQKKITLLGGTGTIGKNTVSIVKDNPEKYSIETIIANKNVEELSKIAIEVGAKNVVIADESKYEKLKGLLGDSGIKLFAGDVEVNNLASEKTDLFVSGAVGFCAESIIHGLVSYKDGSTLAGLSSPDMKVPIAYALAHPERVSTTAGRINLTEVGSLTFEKPDLEKFKCLKIALNALDVGQNCAIALNASNEVSVASFLDGKISFQHIAEITERTIEEIEKNTSNKVSDFEEIFDIDLSARRFAESQIEILNNNRAAG